MNYQPGNSDEDRAPAAHPGDDRVLDARQGADFLNISVKTFRRLGWAGKLPPALRVSDRKLGWRKSDLRAWLKSRQVAA